MNFWKRHLDEFRLTSVTLSNSFGEDTHLLKSSRAHPDEF